MRSGCSPIPLEPCGNEIGQIRTRLDKAERSGKVEEVPAVGTVVKIEKLENIAFYEEICKAHVGMNESKTPAGFAISGHGCTNTPLCALKKLFFLRGEARENAPVAPKSMRTKRSVTVPDRAGDGRYEGGTGRSGRPEATCVLMQRCGKRSEATEEAAHRLPIPLVGSHSIHIYKGNPVKYATVGQRHSLNGGTIEGRYRTNDFDIFKFYFIVEMKEPIDFRLQFPQASIPRAAYAQRCNRFPVLPGHTVCMILGVTQRFEHAANKTITFK